MNWRHALVFLLSAIPACALAADDMASGSSCIAAYQELPSGTILDLLDPGAPEQRRQEALTSYQRLATMKECPEFGYTLGQLYRHGEYLPGNLLPQNLDKARELIRPMAEDGYLPAYADLAEMEMRHANAREAMKWTQAYLYFVDVALMPMLDKANRKHYQRSAYNGNLMARVDLIWRYARPVLPQKLIREDLNAYLAEHETQVLPHMRERLQGGHQRVSAQDGGPIRVIDDAEGCYVKAIDNIGAASATWIVEVLPSGQTGRIVLENFVPKAGVADSLRECLAKYRFAPFEGSQPSTIRISMVMGSPEGATISRRRR